MVNDDYNSDSSNSERPALSGSLGTNHQQNRSGGGGGTTRFAQPDEVRTIFSRGLSQLQDRIDASRDRHAIEATIGRIRLRANALAKSHRHPVLFDKLEVTGVHQPGNILALITQAKLTELADLVNRASDTLLKQLSSVAEISPYEAPVNDGHQRTVMSFFDGRLDDGSSLQERGLATLRQSGMQFQRYGRSRNVFVTTSRLPDDSPRLMPWIRRIRPTIELRSIAILGTNPVRPLNVGRTPHTLPRPIVGVVDSGVDTSIPWLNRLVVTQEHPYPSQYADTSHGSLVGSLAATGGGFTLNQNYFPTPYARILDIQVLGSGVNTTINEFDLVTQLRDAVERYGPEAQRHQMRPDEPVVVWNLSLGGDSPVSEDEFSDLAIELDSIMRDHKVIFTLAAGNYSKQPLRGWIYGFGPDPIATGGDRISPPADSALGISVGSLSDTSNPPSAASADCPSPFSRRGPGPGMIIKPDVVHYGGTCSKDVKVASSVLGPYRNGHPLNDIGTSFAAPRVAAELAKIVEVLGEPEPELLKTILLLSCSNVGDHLIDDRKSVNYYGFGFPNSPVSIMTCNPWECTVFFKGDLRPSSYIAAELPYPSCLENPHTKRRRGHIRMALVYTPVLDATKGAEYCQTNVTASLGRITHDSSKNILNFDGEIPPIPSEHRIQAQYERDLIEHSWKWSPAKVYERKFYDMHIKPNERRWELRAELLLRRELEPMRDQVRQSFWLGIKISDPDQISPVYQEMRQRIESMALAGPLVLRPQIRM